MDPVQLSIIVSQETGWLSFIYGRKKTENDIYDASPRAILMASYKFK